jgi:hypothetical protein
VGTLPSDDVASGAGAVVQNDRAAAERAAALQCGTDADAIDLVNQPGRNRVLARDIRHDRTRRKCRGQDPALLVFIPTPPTPGPVSKVIRLMLCCYARS